MKVTVEMDCTPEEARAFLGLPDVQPMQAALMQELQSRLSANIKAMEPETIMKTWLPAGIQGVDQWQKTFWSLFQKTAGEAAKAASVAKTDPGKPG